MTTLVFSSIPTSDFTASVTMACFLALAVIAYFAGLSRTPSFVLLNRHTVALSVALLVVFACVGTIWFAEVLTY